MFVLKLETLTALIIGHGFDGLYDNISCRYLVEDVSDKLITVEVNKSSLLILRARCR